MLSFFFHPEDVAGLDMDTLAVNENMASICVQDLLREEQFSQLDRHLIWSILSMPYMNAVALFLRRHPFLSMQSRVGLLMLEKLAHRLRYCLP